MTDELKNKKVVKPPLDFFIFSSVFPFQETKKIAKKGKTLINEVDIKKQSTIPQTLLLIRLQYKAEWRSEQSCMKPKLTPIRIIIAQILFFTDCLSRVIILMSTTSNTFPQHSEKFVENLDEFNLRFLLNNGFYGILARI